MIGLTIRTATILAVALTRFCGEAAAFGIVLEDDVDDARDRVGAILRCSAVSQHFDLLDCAGRNEVEVNRVATHGCRPGIEVDNRAVVTPLAVHKNQHVYAREATQTCRAGYAAERRAADRCGLKGWDKLCKHVAKGHAARKPCQVFVVDNINGGWAINDASRRAAKARDDDCFLVFRLVSFRCRFRGSDGSRLRRIQLSHFKRGRGLLRRFDLFADGTQSNRAILIVGPNQTRPVKHASKCFFGR